jgi:hypothetical protein
MKVCKRRRKIELNHFEFFQNLVVLSLAKLRKETSVLSRYSRCVLHLDCSKGKVTVNARCMAIPPDVSDQRNWIQR